MNMDYYEINISKKRTPSDRYGIHWCRIELPDHDEEKAKEKLSMLRLMFGEMFVMNLKHWECRGKEVE